MKIQSKFLLTLLSVITAFSPLVTTVNAAGEQNPQSINVCFVNLDNNGNVIKSLPDGSSVSINIYEDAGHLVEGQINSYGTQSIPISQTSSSIANTDLTNSGSFDSYCVKKGFTNDMSHEYTYTEASINSSLDWLPVRYNDEISINYVHPDIAFPYSGEWFDNIAGNEASRNTNADGHITMSPDRQDRTLVIVSQLDQNLPTYAVKFSDAIAGTNQYTLSTIPSNIQPNSVMNIKLSVQNMGTLKWLSSLDGSAGNPVNISYHWKNLDDDSLSIYNGNRAPLNHDIEYTYNDSNIELTVNAPNAPGNYQLILDLVHEGVTWFSAKGADTKTFNIQVGEIAIPKNPTIVEQKTYAKQESLSIQALSSNVIANYTVQPYSGNPNWHCGGYDCLTGIAEEFYHCSANGIPNDAPNTTDVNILQTKCWWPIYIQNKWIWDTYGTPSQYASQPWNYLQVGWILEIPSTGGVVNPPNPPTPPVLTPVVNINTNSGASLADPYAGLLGTWTGWPQVTFDRWIAWDGSYKDDNIKWSETTRPSAPQLTSIITSVDGNSATIYGVGLPKNFPMNVRVWNEFRYCWACGSAWEYAYQQGTTQNVKVVFFKNNWEYIGEVWNDNPSGRFSINLPKGVINPGDNVFTELQIESDYTFNGLHWWSNTTESRNFNLRDRKYTGYPYFGSGGSGSIRVPEFLADLRSNEEKLIDSRAMALGATGASSITNICGVPAKTYSNLKNGAGAILFVNGRSIYSYGGTWDTFNYYGDKCSRFGVPTDDPHDAGVGPFTTSGAYQDFQKGRIYWSWKYLGKFTYGIISNKYESLNPGGTWSVYGWPTSETYSINTNGIDNICQSFEGGPLEDGKINNTICEKDTAPRADKLIWPLSNSKVEVDPRDCHIEGICGSELFNYNDPMGRTAAHHTGVDLINNDNSDTGNKEVKAFANGTVKLIDRTGGYPGGAIILEHKIDINNTVTTFFTVYMHVDNITVNTGQYISAGSVIAHVLPQVYDNDIDRIVYGDEWVGKPNSHLHFEVRSFYSYFDQRNNNPTACNRDSSKSHDLPIWTVGFGYLDTDGSAIGCGYYDPMNLPANIFNNINLTN
ncbi:MAG: peptidoglycan DD-metalloendopeptidase family protein [Candidatus Dojkabacteria bacterium]